jgi:hypothetical protein
MWYLPSGMSYPPQRRASAGQLGGQGDRFLGRTETVAARTMAAVEGLLAVELTVGLPGQLSLTGSRHRDNYLFSARIATTFACKGPRMSLPAVGKARPDPVALPPQLSAQIARFL